MLWVYRRGFSKVFDDRAVRGWPDLHGLLRKPVEQHPPMARAPTIESKRELVEGVIEMRHTGNATAQLSRGVIQSDGTRTFTVNISATNALGALPGSPGPIDLRVNFIVAPNGRVGIAPGSVADGYPSIAGYAYQIMNGQLLVETLFEIWEQKIDLLEPPMDARIPSRPPE